MIKSLLARMFRKDATGGDKTLSMLLGAGAPLGMATDYSSLSKNGFSANNYVYRAITKVNQGVGSIPWILFQKKGKEKVEIESHPLLDLIERPNPKTSRAEFFGNLLGYLQISGNGYVVALAPGNGGGVPRELWTLRPDWIELLPFGEGPVTEYKYGSGATEQRYKAEQVRHLKTFNPLSQRFGLSPLAVTISSVISGNEAKRWNVALLQNAGRPSGVFSTEGALQETQFNRLREQLTEKYTGSSNAAKPYLLEGGLKWTSTALSPADMDWLEGQKLSAREIATTFGVPPELLGDAANKTYSNYKEARKAFFEETVIPLAQVLRDELNIWLTPLYGEGLELDLDLDGVAALQDDRESLFTRAKTADWLTVNEKRRMTGYEDITGGDVILTPLTLVPLTSAGAPPKLAVDDEPADSEDDMSNTPEDAESGAKAFGMSSEEQKTAYWKSVDALRTQLIGKVSGLVAAQLMDDIRSATAAVEVSTTGGAVDAAVNAVEGHAGAWEKLFARIYALAGETAARRVFESIKSAGVREFKADADTADAWLRTIMQWVQINARPKIRGITATTTGRIRASLLAGISAGEGVQQLADRVEAFGLPEIIAFRSEVIARTETISAANLGSQIAAESTGIPLRREWISTRDGRTRGIDDTDKADHFHMDGQMRSNGEPYREPKTGQQMMFPGDTSLGAGPENVIQCRCVEGFHPIGEKE